MVKRSKKSGSKRTTLKHKYKVWLVETRGCGRLMHEDESRLKPNLT